MVPRRPHLTTKDPFSIVLVTQYTMSSFQHIKHTERQKNSVGRLNKHLNESMQECCSYQTRSFDKYDYRAKSCNVKKDTECKNR